MSKTKLGNVLRLQWKPERKRKRPNVHLVEGERYEKARVVFISRLVEGVPVVDLQLFKPQHHVSLTGPDKSKLELKADGSPMQIMDCLVPIGLVKRLEDAAKQALELMNKPIDKPDDTPSIPEATA